MLALGLNIVIGFAGLLDLGYVAFYAVGAYLFALLSSSHLIENFTFFQYAFPNGFTFSSWTLLFIAAVLAGFSVYYWGFQSCDFEVITSNCYTGVWRDNPNLSK